MNEIKRPSHRAVTFVDANHNDNIFIHDSVEGVKRIFPNQYMELVEAPHEGRYSLQRVTSEHLEKSALVKADADYLIKTVTSVGVSYKTDKVILAFRSVWFAVTGEVMPT